MIDIRNSNMNISIGFEVLRPACTEAAKRGTSGPRGLIPSQKLVKGPRGLGPSHLRMAMLAISAATCCAMAGYQPMPVRKEWKAWPHTPADDPQVASCPFPQSLDLLGFEYLNGGSADPSALQPTTAGNQSSADTWYPTQAMNGKNPKQSL